MDYDTNSNRDILPIVLSSESREMLPEGSMFISGVPATGKSTFGNWLEKTHGYFHLDFDEEDIVQARGLQREQRLLWDHQQAKPLHHALVAQRKPIVLTWGFGPRWLSVVEEILTWGFVPVWFAASRAIARRAFIRRGGIDVKHFDYYMDLIVHAAPEYMAVFGGHVVQPLRDDGSRMEPAEIYTLIF